MRLILASASPRRRELLTEAGFDFDVHAVDVDERPLAGEPPEQYVRRLAQDKSRRAIDELTADRRSGAGRGSGTGSSELLVLGADTAVIVDGEILGKPNTDDESRAMLSRLSGRTHQVLTGLSLRTSQIEFGDVEVTTVWFSPLSDADIAWYVSTGEGRDKAGGYGIQGLAARFIPRIEGSYSNVVGLPVASIFLLISRLRKMPGAFASGGDVGLS